MTAVISIVSFFVVIVVLILAHELGHFISAKATGVKVEEFGLFYPPRLLSVKRGETIYSLNSIPLGGFVKMTGEEDPKAQGSLAGRRISVRLLVLGAGSLMNFLLPVLLFSIAFMLPSNALVGSVTIQAVAPDSPAALAGIMAGDTVLSVNGRGLENSGDLNRYVQLNQGNEISLLIQHPDGTTKVVRVVPRWRPPKGQGATGVMITTSNATVVSQHFPFWKAIPMGFSESFETFVLFKNGIVNMIIGTVPVELAGPVGIAQITGRVAQAGISPLLEFAAFLSINLGIINIFPLPALDGGRIAFVLLEWLRRGKRVAPKAERLVHLIGFGLLLAFFVAITYADIMRIVSGGSLIP